jgi:iron-sulfur cluster insertion protein
MSSIVLTNGAARKVGELITKERDQSLMLRVYIEGGGCSGFQYGFELDAEENDDDTIVQNAGIKMVVDALSYQYLLGSEVDYKEDLMGARFIVSNPNASTTCGCGASFSV